MSISSHEPLVTLLNMIVNSPSLHGRWLNTLSYLENSGARKIAASENPNVVSLEVLKHAAEEFRHAFFLKKQIDRVVSHSFDGYAEDLILGGWSTRHYLHRLDARACRYLRLNGVTAHDELKKMAYIFVTYAIETRASEIYPLYEKMLRSLSSKATVKSIIIEEEGHLSEMTKAILEIPQGLKHAKEICHLESELYERWLQACTQDIDAFIA